MYDAAKVGENILAGTIAESNREMDKASFFFKQAVVDEDKLIYNEPRDWLLPARQYLGAALIRSGRYIEATEVFIKDLQINPNNGWSLTGLETCYRELKNTKALTAVQKQLKAAWSIKDMTIDAPVF